MQDDLGQDRAQHITETFLRHRRFHRFRDGTAQTAAGAGMFGKDLSADRRSLRGRGSNRSTIGAHDFAAVGLLFVRDLDHEDFADQIKVGACHGKRRAPLPCPRFRGNALQALFLCVVRLGDSRVEFVAAGSVVAFKFVIDVGGRVQGLFQIVGADERSGAEHAIKIPDGRGDVDVRRGVVQFLPREFVAEDRAEFLKRHGVVRFGIQQRCRFVLHIGTEVVPLGGDLVFGKLEFVGDRVVIHNRMFLLLDVMCSAVL